MKDMNNKIKYIDNKRIVFSGTFYREIKNETYNGY